MPKKYDNGEAERRSTEYKTCTAIKYRCYNSHAINYKHYGRVGVTVCDRWLGTDGYKNFLSDMGRRPSKKHSIDRIDTKGKYEPNNCRWSTRYCQDRNKSNNVWLEAGGKTMVLSDWAKYWGIPHSYIRSHIGRGKSFQYVYDFYNDKYKTYNQ